MSEEFVDQYMEECIVAGASSPTLMCERAISRLKEIEVEIERLGALRKEKANLMSVLKTFDHDFIKRKSKVKMPIINDDLLDADNNPGYKEVLIKICDVVFNANSPVNPREIVESTGYSTKDPTGVYMGIQWLHKRGIIKRNSDRTIDIGENWNDRPQESQETQVA